MYEADGIADAVNFKLTAGIRGPEHTGSGFKCVDENNCDEEVYFVCARETVGASVQCLAAMDDTRGSAKAKGQACAKAEGADFSKIDACFNSDQGDTLKAAEALYFDTKFPDPVGVPHIEIDGVSQSSRDYNTLIRNLCAKGISAGACGSVVQV